MAEADRPAGPEGISARAEALFTEAASDGAISRVREELYAFARLMRSQPRLRKTLADAGVPGEAKRNLLRALLGTQLDERTLRLLDDLVEQPSLVWRLRPVVEDLAVQAVLAEAESDGTLGDMEEQLFRFARLVEENPRLRSAFTDPVLPDEIKLALVDELLDGRAAPGTATLVRDVIARPGDPAERIQALADRAAARRGRVVVEARTAVSIDDDRRARLEEALSRATGKRVNLEVVVDPSVVGGVVARVGDEVIDGSVKRKLELALEALAG